MATRARTEWTPETIFEANAARLRRLNLEKNVPPALRRRLRAAVKKLNRPFLEQQATLARDLVLDVLENKRDRTNALKQRSAWAAMDAIAIHLDETGFTAVFQKVAAKMFAKQSLADPALVGIETALIQGFCGLNETRAKKLGLGAADLERAMALAEDHRLQADGLRRLTSSKFTAYRGVQEACGRPVGILEVHFKVGKWVPILTFVANIVVLLIPLVGVPISIATIVAGFILAFVAGC